MDTFTAWGHGPGPESYSHVPVPVHGCATCSKESSLSNVLTRVAAALPSVVRRSVPPFPSDHDGPSAALSGPPLSNYAANGSTR